MCVSESRLFSAPAPVPARLPQPCSVRFLLERFLDISSVPKRSFFELLGGFATNELEREKLRELSSAQGQEDLHSYCTRPRRTALEVSLRLCRWGCEQFIEFKRFSLSCMGTDKKITPI